LGFFYNTLRRGEYFRRGTLGEVSKSMVKMSPDMFSFSDDHGNLEIEIDLPGVKKKNI
jgi:HSP20 family molecular chaperone IbpA